MFYSGFRSRSPVRNAYSTEPRIEEIDPSRLHVRVGTVLREQLLLGRDPTEVSDEMATIISSALQRRRIPDVHDHFGIYPWLLMASPFVLRDIYNDFLTEEDLPWVEDPDLMGDAF